MTTKLAVLLAGIGLACSVPVVAHHAVGGEYDATKPVTVTGTVTRIDWTNPHARLYFDVAEPNGTVVNWGVELAARNVLERMGWTIRSLKVGQTITVKGDQARNGAKLLNARAREQRNLQGGNEKDYPITLPDGSPVLNDR
ncbi:MAG: hypothetical protein EXQ53_07335 [Acidobacteria bacterium]|nr:hypothetical protein [Acidobacteriota bacterium]